MLIKLNKKGQAAGGASQPPNNPPPKDNNPTLKGKDLHSA